MICWRAVGTAGGPWAIPEGSIAGTLECARHAITELFCNETWYFAGGVAHCAETKAEPVVKVINGCGPSDTVYRDE
jgi:hypothetical protein